MSEQIYQWARRVTLAILVALCAALILGALWHERWLEALLWVVLGGAVVKLALWA